MLCYYFPPNLGHLREREILRYMRTGSKTETKDPEEDNGAYDDGDGGDGGDDDDDDPDNDYKGVACDYYGNPKVTRIFMLYF